MKILLLLLLILSGCSAANHHVNIKEEINKDVREAFGLDAYQIKSPPNHQGAKTKP
jgi:hypothetical protein